MAKGIDAEKLLEVQSGIILEKDWAKALFMFLAELQTGGHGGDKDSIALVKCLDEERTEPKEVVDSNLVLEQDQGSNPCSSKEDNKEVYMDSVPMMSDMDKMILNLTKNFDEFTFDCKPPSGGLNNTAFAINLSKVGTRGGISLLYDAYGNFLKFN